MSNVTPASELASETHTGEPASKPASETQAVDPNKYDQNADKWLVRLKFAAAIVAAIILMYITWRVYEFMGGPVGKATKDIFGTFGGIVAAVAGLPPWLLIFSGIFIFLFGGAIQTLSRKAIEKLGEKLMSVSEDLKAEVASGKINETESEVIADSLTGAFVAEAAQQTIAESGSNSEAAAIESNALAKAAKADETIDNMPEARRNEVDQSKENAEKNARERAAEGAH